MEPIVTNDSDQPIHIREIYNLMGGMKSEILSEVKEMGTEFKSEIEKSNLRFENEMKLHQGQHEREQNYRSGLFRWTVTTVVVVMLGVSATIIQVLIAKNIL